MEQQISDKIKEIIADIKSFDVTVVTDDSLLYNDLMMDSLDLTDLLNQVECEFDIQIEQDDSFDLKSLKVGEFIEYVICLKQIS